MKESSVYGVWVCVCVGGGGIGMNNSWGEADQVYVF